VKSSFPENAECNAKAGTRLDMRNLRFRNGFSSSGLSAFAAAILLLAGCAANPQSGTVIQQPFFSSYDNSMVRYTAGRGGMLVETIGNPFSVPDAELQNRIAKMMEGAQYGPRMPFFATPPDDFKSIYKLRVSLNAAVTAQRICGKDSSAAAATGQQSGPMRVDAIVAFCSSEKRISSVRGYATNVVGPEDPKLRALLRTMTRLVLPPVDPHRRGNGRDDWDD
jgi:hypothetical protein